MTPKRRAGRTQPPPGRRSEGREDPARARDDARSRRIEVAQGPDGNWEWRLFSPGGRVIAISGGHGSAIAAERRAGREHPGLPIERKPRKVKEVTGREAIVATLVAVVLSVAMTWPMAARLGTHVPAHFGGLGDPLLTAWQLAWLGHAAGTSPTDVFQSNIFQPAPDSFAFSETFMGLAPLAIPGEGGRAALVRHGIIWILSFVVAAFGAYLLARELGAGRGGGLVAGAAFAFAPFRLAQMIHLHILWSGGIPLALFVLLRGYRRERAGWIVGGWAVAAWQVSLGWNLGLPLAYLLTVLGLTGIVALSRVRRLRRLPARVSWATVGGVALFLVVATLMARPYLRVAEAEPASRRSVQKVASFSPPLVGFFSAPQESRVWERLTRTSRALLDKPDEQSLFPGLTVVVLAGIGAAFGRSPRALRMGLLGGTALFAILALGVRARGLGRLLPYRLLYELAPGFQGLRTPGRLITFATLGLALLAAAGAGRVATRKPAVAVALAALIAVEGFGAPIPTVRVPQPPAGLEAAGDELQLHLPAFDLVDLRYIVWSVDGFPPLVNGYSGVFPARYSQLIAQLNNFPDRDSVAALRQYGVRTVVLHPDLARGTAFEPVANRPVEGLDLVKRPAGDLILFELPPVNAPSAKG